MRLVIINLALGLAALGVPGMAAAQGPVATQALAPGEVLVEVNAFGTVSAHADMATLVIPVDTRAATEAEARRQAESMADRIAGAAAAAGVPASDINRHPIVVGQDAMMAAAMRDMERAAAEAQRAASGARPPVLLPPDAAARPTESAHSEVEIKLRGLDRLPQLRRALEAAGLGAAPAPTYALADDRAQRSAARAQAIAQARADAEGYASALGMRVVRIVRVTERVGFDLMTMFSVSTRMRDMMSGMEGRSPEISTNVALGMDFVLAPLR